MKNKIYFMLLLVFLSVGMTAAAVVLLFLNSGLKNDLRRKDEEYRMSQIEKFRSSWRAGPYAEDLMFVRSCNDILEAVSNGVCSALSEYAGVLSREAHSPRIGNCSSAETALEKVFNDSFLWRGNRLLEFDSISSLEVYLRINFELMIHYGNLNIRNGNLESLPPKEYLALKTLNDYKKKFQQEMKTEYERLVDLCMKSLVEHIESPDGFTRICARYVVCMNTDLANAMKPGKGVNHESAMKIGRAVALGLVRNGYTPKWLDKEFPVLEDSSVRH